MTRRDDTLLLFAAVAAPILLFPAYVDPRLGLVFVALFVALPAVVLAERSIVYPVALAGIPALGIALLGDNPLPDKVLFVALTGWLALGLALAALRGEAAGVDGRLLRISVGATAILAVLLLARLQPGEYAEAKVQLFLAQNVLLLLAGVLIARNAARFETYLILALGVAVASAVVLVQQFLSGAAEDLYSGRFTISSVDANPILAGRHAATGVLIAVYFVLTARKGWLRATAFAALPLLGISLVGAGSRGPVLSLVVGLLVLVSLSLADQRTRARLLTVAVAAGVGAAIVPLLVPGDAIERSTSFLIGSQEGLSSNGRFELWGRAVDAFLEHPLLGLGTGGFAELEPVLRYPHNIGLEAAAELGIVGLAAVAVLLAATAAQLAAVWRGSADATREHTALAGGLFAAGLVNALLSDDIGGSAQLWLAAGLAAGLEIRAKDHRAGED